MPDDGEFIPKDCAAARERKYPGGFNDFFRREYRAIVKALMFAGASMADADDCAAHAMEKLLERWDLPTSHPRYVHRPRAYAMTTARHRFEKERRDRLKAVPFDEAESEPAVAESTLTLLENRQFVEYLLNCLPPAPRQVMYLITEGYSSGEIAEILRKTPNNVRQNAHRAKELLRPLVDPLATESPHGGGKRSDQR